jgi:putative membrane protein
MNTDLFIVIVASGIGAALSSVFACAPGLHVYNLMGLMVLGVHTLNVHGIAVPVEMLVPFAVSMIVGYAMLNTVPSVLLAAPDESALFTVLPGQKYLMAGRGYEATVITAAGGLLGLLLLVLTLGLVGPRFLPVAKAVFQPHVHWILWCVIAFMLLSEWPKGGTLGQAGWRRFSAAWKSTGAGLLTFLLAGFLGFILLYRSPIPVESAFQNLMPAFMGLFTLPWLILNIVSRVEIPEQQDRISVDLDKRTLAKGVLAGSLGGGFAAFFPVVTGGVGGLLAGHATAIRDDRVFLVSQGTSKLIYYVGGFLLLFVPDLWITRGGGAWLMKTLYTPHSYRDYFMVLAAAAWGGMVSFLLVGPLTQATLLLIRKWGYRRISWIALITILAFVGGITGRMGLWIAAISAGIGLLPLLLGSRRMNCLGVILLPMACNMSGIGETVARWLGLV